MSHTLSASVIRWATDDARRLVRSAGSFPVDIVAIARSVGVSRVEAREMSHDGYVGRDSADRLVIRYRSANSGERNRFTIAHEIGHILLARASNTDVMDPKLRRGNNSEETAANRIAAELLMPQLAMQRMLADSKVSWESVLSLRRAFGVSTSALVRRVVEVGTVPAVFLQVFLDDATGLVRTTRCASSSDPSVRLLHTFRLEADRAIFFSSRRVAFNIPVSIDGCRGQLRCVSRAMCNFGRPQYWAVGWVPKRALQPRFVSGILPE